MVDSSFLCGVWLLTLYTKSTVSFLVVALYFTIYHKKIHKYKWLFADDEKETEAIVVYTLIEGIYSYDVTQEKPLKLHFTICINNRMQREKRAQKRHQERHENPAIYGTMEPETERMDQLPDTNGVTPEEHHIQREEKQALWHIIYTLPLLEQQIIQLRYQYRYTYEEIGKRLGISRKRASQLHGKALLVISASLRKQGRSMPNYQYYS